jgi:hypothetical protein
MVYVMKTIKKMQLSFFPEIDNSSKTLKLKSEDTRSMGAKKSCFASPIISIRCFAKVYMQERLLLANLSELHAVFMEENKDNQSAKVGRSKFAELRPPWCVSPGAWKTHNVCICIPSPESHNPVTTVVAGYKPRLYGSRQGDLKAETLAHGPDFVLPSATKTLDMSEYAS